MLAKFALANGKALLFGTFALAAFGAYAYTRTPQSIFPTMAFSRIDVVVDACDLPPDRVRVAVARPIEQALQALPSVASVQSTSSQGTAEFLVDFTADVAPQNALQAVDERIAQIRSDVPAARAVTAAAVDPNREPVVSYALTSKDLSQAVVRELATAHLLPALYGVPGLDKVLVSGGPDIEYRVNLDPSALAAAGLSAADVGRALSEANDVRGVGFARRYGRDYALLLDSSLDGAAAFARVEVPLRSGATIRVGDLGSVVLATAPVASNTSIDGKPAVIVNAYAARGADAVAMAGQIRSRIEAAARGLPAGTSLVSFWDQTTLIVASQTALRDAILLGALLAVLVIFAFLRDVRLTLVAAAVIPVAIAIALLVSNLAGQTLNLMSVGGLAVAVGLIIDDAIVVVEGIARARTAHPGDPLEQTIVATMQRLGRPMTVSTAATIVVFLPLTLLGGVAGFFFRALAFTLGSALAISLLLALLVTPALAAALRLRGRAGDAEPESPRYERALSWSLAHRPLVAFGCAIVLGATVFLLARAPSDFLPKMDEGEFEIGYALPVGTDVASSDAAAREAERVIGADPAVAAVAGLTGLDSNGVSPTLPDRGALRVRLKPRAQRDGYDAVSQRLRDELGDAVPSGLFDFRQILEDLIADLSGNVAPIEIRIRGDDQQTLVALAQKVAGKIARVPGIVDAAADVAYDMPSVRIAPRQVALTALGAGTQDVADALAAQNGGNVVTAAAAGAVTRNVRVALATPPATLDGQPVALSGGTVALDAIAGARIDRNATDIQTVDGRTTVRVIANVDGVSLSAVGPGIASALASVPLPPGYSAEVGGDIAAQSKTFSQFTGVLSISVLLVYGVMLAAFRSFRVPLVIVAAIPLALIGVALALTITRTAVNVSSFMGLLLLVGVVVKNGILLLDVAERRRAGGADVREALSDAGRTRLRPILMTTLAAIGGLLPLATGFGEGSEMERPLAIAVIGGLATATAFTLIVIPVLYATLAAGRAGRTAGGAAIAAFALLASAHPAVAQPDVAAPQTPAVRTFASVTLAAGLQAAVDASPDVAAAQAREREAAFALAQARGQALPSFVAAYAQTPQGNPPGPNITSRQVTAELQWSVSDLLASSQTTRAAAFSYAAAQADREVAENDERVKTAGLYYEALRARALVTAARAAVDAADAARTAAQTRFDAGDAPRLDVVRAGVDLAKAQSALETATAADANATGALAVETALPAARFESTATDPSPVAEPPYANDANAAVALAVSLRPEIRSARRTADAAAASAGAARSSSLPDATVSGGYLDGTDSGVPVHAPAFNASLTVPIGNAGASRAASAVAAAAEARAKAAGVERTILLEVAAATRSFVAAERAEAASARALDLAGQELRATEIGYRSGASSSLEASAARATYAQAVADEAGAAYDVRKARAILALQVGR